MKITKQHSALVFAIAVGFAAIGCSGKVNDSGIVSKSASGLHQAQSCADLESMLKADALAKMNAVIDAQIAAYSQWGGGGYYGAPEGTADAGVATGGMGGSAGGSAPGKDDSGSSSAGSGGATNTGSNSDQQSASTGHSVTNTQVEGVDEADIVKTDGKYIYLLHGQKFLVLNAWPASELGQTTSFGIEGQPLEMFVADKKVVVYSNVDGTSIYAAAGVTPRPGYYDYGYGYATGVANGVDQAPGYGYGYAANPLIKLTVLSIADVKSPVVEKELYFEGTYASSRRVDSYVRTVLSGGAHGPLLDYYPQYDYNNYPKTVEEWKALYEALRAKNTAKINASTYQDWLPYYMTKENGAVTANLPACDEYYVPDIGTTTYGLTQVESIDLNALATAPKGATVVGAAQTVYATANSLYVAASAYNAVYGVGYATSGTATTGGSSSGVSGSSGGVSSADAGSTTPVPSADAGIGSSAAALEPQTIDYTYLHKFDLTRDPSTPLYQASGTVPGTILNQFAIDEYNGFVRVATTEQRISDNWQSSRVNNLFVLAGDLNTVGSYTDLAQGETIYATRFIGPKAYVVTYLQKDPLFVFDLSDPTAPALLGQVTIPGFSQYMHPLDDGHLLTIGQQSNGQLALQIFDVTNPAQPKQSAVYDFSGTEYGYSEAQSNYKAFTYYAPEKMLVFPFIAYASNGMRSSLEVFRVDVNSGIQKAGSIDHSDFFSADPYGYCGYDVGVRRGLFIQDNQDDFLYSISYGGVKVHNVNNLNTPVRSLPLELPTQSGYNCGYGGYGGAGGAGDGGFAGSAGSAGGSDPGAGGSSVDAGVPSADAGAVPPSSGK